MEVAEHQAQCAEHLLLGLQFYFSGKGMKKTSVYAVVLAAGKGTRMKSDKAKVLHEVFFQPMIHHVMDALSSLDISETVVVIGHQGKEVEASLSELSPIFVVQEAQLGTGHAVLATEKILGDRSGTVLILCGDTPLIQGATLKAMLSQHRDTGGALTLMTTELDDPTNYGRIISAPDGSVLRIVEEKDAEPAQKSICEINAGIYCVDAAFLFKALAKVGTDNKQGEMYLTDIVEVARKTGLKVNRFVCPDSEEILGVNSRVELAEAHAALQKRRNYELMLAGVTMYQPETISIEKTVSVAPDTVIFPNTQITGKTTVGKGVQIGSFSMLHDCRIGDGVTIGAYSHLTGMHVAEGSRLLPRTVHPVST